MATKRLFFVFGPESSGSRLIKRVLMAAGCDGTDDNDQKWDFKTPSDEPLVAWHRSFPHGRAWIDVEKYVEGMRARGYDVQAVVTTRDWLPLTVSGARNHARSWRLAKDRVRRAYAEIFYGLYKSDVPYLTISYEAMVQRPKQVIQWLTAALGLPDSSDEILKKGVRDGNEKYYAGKKFDENVQNWINEEDWGGVESDRRPHMIQREWNKPS